MKITSANFVTSNSEYQLCPPAILPEYAFIGRSNVGKSSLINMLTGKKSLAKTSQIPGKTQLINHFLINQSWYLVDLPGYGYAKISKSERDKWEGMINDYLKFRPNLVCTFVLIDSRHDPVKNDLDFMEKLGEEGIPFHIIFTKIDKLKKSEMTSKIDNYIAKLLEVWEEAPRYFVSSAEKDMGREEILTIIDEYNKAFRPA